MHVVEVTLLCCIWLKIAGLIVHSGMLEWFCRVTSFLLESVIPGKNCDTFIESTSSTHLSSIIIGLSVLDEVRTHE